MLHFLTSYSLYMYTLYNKLFLFSILSLFASLHLVLPTNNLQLPATIRLQLLHFMEKENNPLVRYRMWNNTVIAQLLCNYCNMMVENTCRKEAEKISGRNFVEVPECLNFTQWKSVSRCHLGFQEDTLCSCVTPL